MPRRAFLADVEALSSQAASGLLPRVEQISRNTADDTVTVKLVYHKAAIYLTLVILCGDIDNYPHSRAYFVSFENAPYGYDQVASEAQSSDRARKLRDIIHDVNRAIIRFQNGMESKKDPTLLPPKIEVITIHDSESERDTIPKRLTSTKRKTEATGTGRRTRRSPAPPRRSTHPVRIDAGLEDEDTDIGDGIEFVFEDSPGEDDLIGGAEDDSIAYFKTTGTSHPTQRRISEELKVLRQNGYYFGVIQGMDETSKESLLSVSIRTADLGLSPQMLLAWDLDPNMFIVLLIQINTRYMGYKTFLNTARPGIDICFRIGTCSTYKPSKHDAVNAFGPSEDKHSEASRTEASGSFSKILISNSLAHLMNRHFLSLARYREDTGCSWASAIDAIINSRTHHQGERRAGWDNGRTSDDGEKSFPLTAMQFAMDQLTNCMSYCQACYSRIDVNRQSLKPSVCSRELCLYQHINLGLGRSVEYEILCQPTVVDLLISFCYAALRASFLPDASRIDRMRTYPAGLLLKVVDWYDPHDGIYSHSPGNRTSFIMSRNASSKTMIDEYRPGQWVVVFLGDFGPPRPLDPVRTTLPFDQLAFSHYLLRHALIMDVDTNNSTIYLQHFGSTSTPASNKQAKILRYTKDLDEVAPGDRAFQLLTVLDSLPSVSHLKTELEKPSVLSLKDVSGVSPAAAVLLGWIIATNSSCILQIHEPDLMVKERAALGQPAPLGGGGLLQFCILQGQPEADDKFQKQLVHADHPAYPTLLAWHGSRIFNWHSILRTGLDFTAVDNGRSFGDGVYLSHAYQVSASYAENSAVLIWPKSTVDLTSIISLNEVINAPSKFTSVSPHYVVQHQNWIRCRFLFARIRGPPGVSMASQQQQPRQVPTSGQNMVVQNQSTQTSIYRWQAERNTHQASAQQGYFGQDPKRLALGPMSQQIEVPSLLMQTSKDGSWAVKKTKRVGAKAANDLIMDARDLGFITSGNSKTNAAETGKNKHAAPAKTKSFSSTKVPSTAIVIDLISDSDIDDNLQPKIVTQPAPRARAIAKAKDTATPTPAAVAVKANPVRSDVTPFQPGSLNYGSLQQLPVPSWCTPRAQRALALEVDGMQKTQKQAQVKSALSDLGWYIDFNRLDNMFQWIVELHSFDRTLPLARDMMSLGVPSIVCELRFGADFPLSPPMVRIIRPRFLPFLQGGGGNVTAGGAMCLELLTSTGWRPTFHLEAVLLQVRMAVCDTDRPARLCPRTYKTDYGIGEAFAAYKRAAATHGWQVPSDMESRMKF